MRIIFLGDVMLGRLVNDILLKVPPEYVWGDTLSLLARADARIVNLECVMSDRGEPWPGKVFTYRSDTKNIAVLQKAGITALTLANNHSLDYGHEALVECLDTLERHAFPYAGAGRTIEEATRPATFAVGASTIATIAFTDNEPSWAATPGHPGVFFAPVDIGDGRFRHLVRLVQAAKRSNNFVIVSAHWGPNWGRDPLPEHREAAYALIEAGVDIIFGHSPHIFRGIEIYKGRPILYSCGDFIDDYAVDEIERNDWSFIFQIDYADTKMKEITLIPTVIRDFQARLAEGSDRQAILEKMATLCADLGTKATLTKPGLMIKIS